MQIFANFATNNPYKILANYADSLYYNEVDGKIHAIPIGESFMNNIVEDDTYIVYDKLN